MGLSTCEDDARSRPITNGFVPQPHSSQAPVPSPATLSRCSSTAPAVPLPSRQSCAGEPSQGSVSCSLRNETGQSTVDISFLLERCPQKYRLSCRVPDCDRHYQPFTNSSTARRHENTHLPAELRERLHCTDTSCKKSFLCPSALRHHEKRKHNVVRKPRRGRPTERRSCAMYLY